MHASFWIPAVLLHSFHLRQVEFGVNAEAQKFLSKSGETLTEAINSFTSDMNTLVNKTIEDTMINAKQYETARWGTHLDQPNPNPTRLDDHLNFSDFQDRVRCVPSGPGGVEPWTPGRHHFAQT